MTLPIERARSRRPITWLTMIGVILLPVVIGGLLVAALYNPVDRLDSMSAAIVNEDDPVTINDQLVPLGRQLTAGLVKGSDDAASNLDWTISNADDAKDGLADGRYAAVITIPKDFSAAATSTKDGATAKQATIKVETAPDALAVDDAITATITQTAASVFGQAMSKTYLENVFLGFTTLGDKLGDAADGATQLADGARDASTGAVSLADGVRALSTGTSGIASGASSLASGTSQWAAGADKAANGLDSWAAGAQSTADGTKDLAAGITKMADQVAQLPAIPQEIVDGVNQVAANSEQIKKNVADAASQLDQLAADCAAQGGSAELCSSLTDVAAQANGALPKINDVLDQSGTIATQVSGLAQFGPQLTQGLRSTAAGATKLANGMQGLASGASNAASGVHKLADGADGIATGAGKLSSGAAQLAAGAAQAADGTDSLASGVGKLADGTDSLADGLHTAADSLPSYTDAEAKSLAGVVADPVAAKGIGTQLFGASAIPLLAMLALWFGGIGSYIVLQAVSRRALTSRRPSALLAVRALWPAAAIGAVQGVLVSIVVQLAANYEFGTWAVFAGLCVIAGIAFAAVNQALVAVFGGAGRWIAALIGVLAVATGIVSTAPGVLAGIAAVMPTAPAYHAMVAALTTAGGVGAGIAGLVVWTVLAFIATTLAVVRRRTASARALLRAAPVAA